MFSETNHIKLQNILASPGIQNPGGLSILEQSPCVSSGAMTNETSNMGRVRKTELSPLNSSQEKGNTLFEDEGMFCLVQGVCLWLGLRSLGRVSTSGVPEPSRARLLWVEACPALVLPFTPRSSFPPFILSFFFWANHRPGGWTHRPTLRASAALQSPRQGGPGVLTLRSVNGRLEHRE